MRWMGVRGCEMDRWVGEGVELTDGLSVRDGWVNSFISGPVQKVVGIL